MTFADFSPDPPPPFWRRPRFWAAAVIVGLCAVFLLDGTGERGLGPAATVAASILGVLLVWVITFIAASIPIYVVHRAVEKVQAVRRFVRRVLGKASPDPDEEAMAAAVFETRLARWTLRALQTTAAVTLAWSVALFFARRYGYFDLVFQPLAVVVATAYILLVLMTVGFVLGRALDLAAFLGETVTAPLRRLMNGSPGKARPDGRG